MASRKPANVAGINPITNYFSRLTPQQLPKGASGDDGVTSPNTSQALPVRTPGVSKSAGNKENARSDDAGLEMDTSEPAGLSPHGTRSYVDAKEKQTSEENSDVIMHDAFSTPAKFRDDNVLVSADSDEICGVDGEDAALGSQSLQSASTASIWQNVGQTVDGSMKEAECRTPEKADRALWDVDFVASSVHPERALNILSSERQHYWRAPKIHHDDVNVEYSESGRETAPGEAVPLGGIRLPPMRRDDDDSSESSDDELRDIDALLGIKGAQTSSAVGRFASDRRHSSRATRNVNPTYTGFPSGMDEDAAAKAPEPSKPARGSWTLDKILKDKRENVKRARLLEELEKKDTDTLQARGGPVEVMMADLQPATDNEDKEIDPLPPLVTNRILSSVVVYGSPPIATKAVPPFPDIANLKSKRLRIRTNKHFRSSIFRDRCGLGHELPQGTRDAVVASGASPAEAMATKMVIGDLLCSQLPPQDPHMELVERLVSIGMPRELALLSGDLAEALGKKTELPQGKLALDLRRSYLVCGVLERIISASVNQNPTSREVAASLIGTLDSSLLPSALLQLCRNLERALRNFDENLAVSLAVELAELLSPIVKGDHEIQLLILNRLSAACASASVLKTQLARQFLLNLNPRQPITAADLAEGAGIALRSISRLHDAPADGPFHDITDFAKLAGAVEVLFHALGSSGPVRMEESVLRLMTGELRAWYNRINDMTAMHLDRTLAKHNLLSVRIWLEASLGAISAEIQGVEARQPTIDSHFAKRIEA